MEERLHVFDEIRHPKKRAFLMAFSDCGSVTQAAEASGISRAIVYVWKQEDDAFHAEMEKAEQIAADELEHVARERAKAGSDTLLIFLLKGLRPDKYGDSLRIRRQMEQLSDEDLNAVIDSGRALAEADTPS